MTLRKQYHFSQSAQGLLAWDIDRLIRLTNKLTPEQIALSSINELNECYWYDLGNAKPTCINILEHIQLINATDLSYPIILDHQGKLMDGMHRVCKAKLNGESSILAYQFISAIEPDFIGCDPELLPY